MTDAGAPIPYPPSNWDQAKVFLADVARPFAIVATSSAVSIATVDIGHAVAKRAGSFAEAAIYVTAIFAGLAALYGAKAWEKSQEGKHAATVAVAQAAGATNG